MVPWAFLFLLLAPPGTARRHSKGFHLRGETDSGGPTDREKGLSARLLDASLRGDPVRTHCEELFGTRTISHLWKDRRSYCQEDSPSDFTCYFSRHLSRDSEEAFCEGTNFETQRHGFVGNCQFKPGLGRHNLQFSNFMYDTGLNPMMHSVHFGKTHCKEYLEGTTFIHRREGNPGNIFHVMQEIYAHYLTSLAVGSRPNNTRIVYQDGFAVESAAFGPIWNALAGLGLMRQDELLQRNVCLRHVVLQLPGGTSPFWRGDWVPYPCHSQILPRAFVQFVFDAYKLPPVPPVEKTVVTYIQRRGRRNMHNDVQIFEAIRKRHPDVLVRLVDFADNLTMSQQIEIARGTNVLVGVHGAGMTHSLFLPYEAAVIEIFPPKLFKACYRNMAKQLGHIYYSMEAEPTARGHDWANQAIRVNSEALINLVSAAIAATHHFGGVVKHYNR